MAYVIHLEGQELAYFLLYGLSESIDQRGAQPMGYILYGRANVRVSMTMDRTSDILMWVFSIDSLYINQLKKKILFVKYFISVLSLEGLGPKRRIVLSPFYL
jgi:hypothetical protein